MSDQEYLRNVVTLELDENKCIGCGMCLNVCPHAVFQLEGNKARIVNKDACMECGACSNNCPVEAISVKSGVGCATAFINGLIRGTEPTCDCSGKQSKGCCG